jgi:hypothetical protein
LVKMTVEVSSGTAEVLRGLAGEGESVEEVAARALEAGTYPRRVEVLTGRVLPPGTESLHTTTTVLMPPVEPRSPR